MFTKIHPTYKANLLAVINQYLKSKPQHSLERIEDMVALRRIIESDYEDHLDLVVALKKYVQTINTGFNLFGIPKLHIKTGSSRLKQHMEEAMQSMSLATLKEWDEACKAELERTYSSNSSISTAPNIDEILARLHVTENENERLQQERAVLEETCRQMILQYNRLKASFETLQSHHQEKQALLDQLIEEKHCLRKSESVALNDSSDIVQENDILEEEHSFSTPIYTSTQQRQSFLFR
ncbi:MAG: hypothetical protein K0S08_664 [Gammaproteobacteria bacterium]|jgi:chromosome segregation ATPase|nr:hypothetical protein [Gammaproteobacteria bacterium]